MRRTKSTFIMAGIVYALLVGCDNGAPQQSAPPAAKAQVPMAAADEPPATASTDETIAGRRFQSWAGRWTGVEGMYVDVTPLGAQRYSLEMQSDLDTNGTYEGREDERSIRFQRDGEQLSLRRSNGDETGLKWLAGKQDCLMVREGEGYCRD